MVYSDWIVVFFIYIYIHSVVVVNMSYIFDQAYLLVFILYFYIYNLNVTRNH